MDGTEGHRAPALQVIVLGPGGGPQEANTTAFLVRSLAQNWQKGSVVAVDAGIHLSAITRLLRETQQKQESSLSSSSSSSSSGPPPPPPQTLTTGPFAGLSLPHRTVDANAGYITSSLIESYLITHPHLDHISGFVINTAGPPGARPKKLAGLPGTIHALKTHVFNNVIWPNLSDENNGAGLFTYLRLVEGGSPALGVGQGKGYSEICDGLLVKIWAVSHGHCIEKHSHRGSASSAVSNPHDSLLLAQTPRRDPLAHHSASQTPRRHSLLGQATLAGGGGGGGSAASTVGATSPLAAAAAAAPIPEQERVCVYDSSAYFIQEQQHHREVLIFGDVEPDSMSLSPRNLQVWREAAPKVASGSLAAVFIECSYDDARGNDRLFGHLKPVFVVEELHALAMEVEAARRRIAADSHEEAKAKKKRKRTNTVVDDDEPVSPKTSRAVPDDPDPLVAQLASPENELSLRGVADHDDTITGRNQLAGLKVVLIHIKEQLSDEQEDVPATILREVKEHEAEAQLGCEFFVAKAGQSFYL